MAKRVSSFADDFKRLSETAETAVQLVRDRESKRDKIPQVGKVDNRDEASPGESTNPAKESNKSGVTRSSTKKKSTKSKEWGKPSAIFNTRIPEEMSGLLDDLVYRFRKKGKPRSKQDLAQEAIQDLLEKHNLL